MCLILLAWQTHPKYPLVVAANRDEFFARPAQAAAFWPDAPEILAGRDIEAGGSWLGVSREGRFAALTNFREGGKNQVGAPSRGALVSDFLSARNKSPAPEIYLSALAGGGGLYNGFNLFAGDRHHLGYYSNRGGAPCLLSPGVYGLSNHLLDTPWPKLSAAKEAFAGALDALPDTARFFELLADREIVPDTHLPETGVPLEWERILSAVFVVSPAYGTRASTLLTIDAVGTVELIERSFGPGATPNGEARESFVIR